MLNEKSCSTGLAFDNYDRFTENFLGKDTLHDTVGIAYQNWNGNQIGIANWNGNQKPDW